MDFQAFLMTELTDGVIDALLLQQDIELRARPAATNYLLHSIIAETDESELFAAGRRLIRSDEAGRKILGIRLLRELRQYQREAAAELAGLLDREHDDEVICWIVSAFGFLRSDALTDRLRALAAHRHPGVRYHVATALANSGGSSIPAESVDALLALSRDVNAEVRFSAVFELGSWWQASHDTRIESALRHAAASDNDPVVARTAREALSSR